MVHQQEGYIKREATTTYPCLHKDRREETQTRLFFVLIILNTLGVCSSPVGACTSIYIKRQRTDRDHNSSRFAALQNPTTTNPRSASRENFVMVIISPPPTAPKNSGTPLFALPKLVSEFKFLLSNYDIFILESLSSLLKKRLNCTPPTMPMEEIAGKRETESLITDEEEEEKKINNKKSALHACYSHPFKKQMKRNAEKITKLEKKILKRGEIEIFREDILGIVIAASLILICWFFKKFIFCLLHLLVRCQMSSPSPPTSSAESVPFAAIKGLPLRGGGQEKESPLPFGIKRMPPLLFHGQLPLLPPSFLWCIWGRGFAHSSAGQRAFSKIRLPKSVKPPSPKNPRILSLSPGSGPLPLLQLIKPSQAKKRREGIGGSRKKPRPQSVSLKEDIEKKPTSSYGFPA